jgi:hypothetical protein
VNHERISPLRLLKWLALTVACALPLHVAIMGRAEPPAFAGEVFGFATWATGMTLLDSFLAQRRSAITSRALTIGFSIWAVVHAALVLVAYGAGSGAWVTPYAYCAMPGMLLLGALDSLHSRGTGEPFAVYVLTVSCGLFDFVAGLLVAWLVAALTRPSRSPPPDTAPSPVPPPPPPRG